MIRIFWTSRLFCFLLVQCLAILPLLANKEDQFKNRVNLALRQAGHNLLQEQGDSTSSIAPIEYDGSYGFLLPLQSVFDYSKLPGLVKRSFEDYGISGPYELVVKSCDKGIPLLGYNEAALDRGDIPCQTRGEIRTCANIFVQFPDQFDVQPDSSQISNLTWLIIPMLAGFGFLFYRKVGATPATERERSNHMLGQYAYDPKNQLLTNGSDEITLTFRENKLLQLFASQPNQVLTRSEILSVVWEDEGVIVGRSLDVFISRLRKLLKQDPAVQIKNVHGVGYRLEVPGK